MKRVGLKKLWILVLVWSAVAFLQLFEVADCRHNAVPRKIRGPGNGKPQKGPPPVQLRQNDKQVVLDNGILQLTLLKPEGHIIGVQHNGADNLLAAPNDEDDRGYWDVNWNGLGKEGTSQRINGRSFRVIKEDEEQVEISFFRTWSASLDESSVPLNIDKRYIMRKGASGFYTYATYERLEGWPDFDIGETRIVFKLHKQKFHYMAVSDDRQRIMPMPDDRSPSRSQRLAYPEAVLLTDPIDPELRGEVDDKYQYSCENKDNRVHGWVSNDPRVGFWLITPSNEFRNGGPIKQDLTSHVGPITLGMFQSTHYAGRGAMMRFRNGEPWKKAFGPVFVYLNSFSPEEDPISLWEDAKEQMLIETRSWPYNFVQSEDFPPPEKRGRVFGQLQVHDRYISNRSVGAASAHVGLALPGEAGSWQTESKGYQFWTQADKKGYFIIKDIRPGVYNLYAWVPGLIGEYRLDADVTISPGNNKRMGVLVYEPPRDGPTLWEIGIPDRSAAEFFIPDPNPTLMNQLYVNRSDKFRQYGLWQRYAELYPDQDLVYEVGHNDYSLDWFFAHVTRYAGNDTYQPTTWQIKFDLERLNQGVYKLRLALASAQESEIQVRFNNLQAEPAHFSTGFIGKDNAIARHGIHGLYQPFNIDVPSSLLIQGKNTIFLTQTRHMTPFQGVMYDYIRLEGPPTM